MTAAENTEKTPMDGAPEIDFDRFRPTRSAIQRRNIMDHFMWVLIAVAFVIALVLTYIKPFDENVEKSERAIKAEKKAVLKIKSEPTAVVAPVDGELIALSQVDDKTFASGVVGASVIAAVRQPSAFTFFNDCCVSVEVPDWETKTYKAFGL